MTLFERVYLKARRDVLERQLRILRPKWSNLEALEGDLLKLKARLSRRS